MRHCCIINDSDFSHTTAAVLQGSKALLKVLDFYPYIPSHEGIKGKENADTAARAGLDISITCIVLKQEI